MRLKVFKSLSYPPQVNPNIVSLNFLQCIATIRIQRHMKLAFPAGVT
jgi:hypothetical protein